MNAIEFIRRYPVYVAQIERVVNPEFKEAVKELRDLDPHDIVKPDHYFNSEAEAIGVVFCLFLKKQSSQSTSPESKADETELKIEAAKKLLAANGIQSQGLWCVEDIIDKAKELKIRCSKKDAREILSDIEQNFDAEYGISWQTIEMYVREHFQNKKT